MVQWRSSPTSALALGTETLADRDMVFPSFDYAPGSLADTLPIEIFEHRRFLRVERSVKKLIIPERNALPDDTIKACCQQRCSRIVQGSICGLEIELVTLLTTYVPASM
jgi:hypothetical protein